jgi:membrane protein
LCTTLGVDPLVLGEVVEILKAMDWIGKLQDDTAADGGARWVLLIDPVQTPVAPLVEALLLVQEQLTAGFWRSALRPGCMLHEVLA